jgi:hypothetical protein
MLVHSVFFWLRDDLTDEQRAAFSFGVDTLATIDSAAAVYIGTPADTKKRPVVDDSYDIGLTVVAEDVAAHDAYQVHPIHTAFVDEFKTYWDRVTIYDVY